MLRLNAMHPLDRFRRTRCATALVVLLALCLHVSLGAPVKACGFHATIFTGEFAQDWARLKKDPNPAMTNMAIQELLRILCFVDPYNSAPDSPAWMHSEEGREHARESAIAILHELGPKAASQVWEALEEAIRFQDKDLDRAMQKVRAAQAKMSTALGEIRVALSKDRIAAIKLEAPSEKDVLIAQEFFTMITTLGMAQVPLKGSNIAHRPLVADRIPNMGEAWGAPLELTLLAEFPEIKGQCAEAQWQYEQAQAEMQQAISAYNAILGRLNRSSQMIGGDMVPCDEYLSDLQTVLLRIGKDALPVLKKNLNHRNKNISAMAQKLAGVIESQKEPARASIVRDRSVDARRIAEVALICWDLADPVRGSKTPEAALENLKARGLQGLGDVIDVLACSKMKMKKEAADALALLTGEKLGMDAEAWKKWYAEALEAEKRKPLPPDLAVEGLSIGLTPDAKKNPPKLLKLPEKPLVETPDEPEKEPTAEERVKDALMPEGQEKKAEAEKSGKSEEKTEPKHGKSNLEDEDADRKHYDP